MFGPQVADDQRIDERAEGMGLGQEALPDAVQAAYRRTTYLGTPDNPGSRVKLMEAWGSYCIGAGSSEA